MAAAALLFAGATFPSLVIVLVILCVSAGVLAVAAAVNVRVVNASTARRRNAVEVEVRKRDIAEVVEVRQRRERNWLYQKEEGRRNERCNSQGRTEYADDANECRPLLVLVGSVAFGLVG